MRYVFEAGEDGLEELAVGEMLADGFNEELEVIGV